MLRPSALFVAVAIVAMMSLTASVELAMGRRAISKSGVVRLWAGDIWSAENSQQFLDPYSFTHILHGVIFYAGLWLVAGGRMSPAARLIAAVAFECGWEMLENSSFVIERYRAQTISIGYYGDTVLNSMGDICSMMFGFYLASRLPAPATAVGAVILDAALALIYRDNLILNIIMLIYPVPAIKNWQAAGQPKD